MSAFSQLLSQYMEEKKVQVYGLARYCGYDRVNMYKVIKGKRNPPGKDFVEKIAEYMHLPLLEKECLYEAYEISVVDYDNDYRRKAVMRFLNKDGMKEIYNISKEGRGVSRVRVHFCQSITNVSIMWLKITIRKHRKKKIVQ